MKPFREWYAERTGSPWPALTGEHAHEVWKRVLEATADYMDALREELQPSHLMVGLQCPWCFGSDQHETTCEYRSYGTGSIVPMRGRYDGPHPSPLARKAGGKNVGQAAGSAER